MGLVELISRTTSRSGHGFVLHIGAGGESKPPLRGNEPW